MPLASTLVPWRYGLAFGRDQAETEVSLQLRYAVWVLINIF